MITINSTFFVFYRMPVPSRPGSGDRPGDRPMERDLQEIRRNPRELALEEEFDQHVAGLLENQRDLEREAERMQEGLAAQEDMVARYERAVRVELGVIVPEEPEDNVENQDPVGAAGRDQDLLSESYQGEVYDEQVRGAQAVLVALNRFRDRHGEMERVMQQTLDLSSRTLNEARSRALRRKAKCCAILVGSEYALLKSQGLPDHMRVVFTGDHPDLYPYLDLDFSWHELEQEGPPIAEYIRSVWSDLHHYCKSQEVWVEEVSRFRDIERTWRARRPMYSGALLVFSIANALKRKGLLPDWIPEVSYSYIT